MFPGAHFEARGALQGVKGALFSQEGSRFREAARIRAWYRRHLRFNDGCVVSRVRSRQIDLIKHLPVHGRAANDRGKNEAKQEGGASHPHSPSSRSASNFFGETGVRRLRS
jgi:hypothetical protein